MRSGGILVALLGMAACTGGAVFTSSSGGTVIGSGGGSGSVGEPPSMPPPPSTSEPVDLEPPLIACSIPAGDAGDAGSDAESPLEGDAGDPCWTLPAPECANQTSMVQWVPLGCDGEQCRFEASLKNCPGGCFRQMDGGERCNE